MASALGSLLANYTDSEGEEDARENDEEDGEKDKISDNDSIDMNPTLAERLTREGTPSGTPGSAASGVSGERGADSPRKNGSMKLVSYLDPDMEAGDDESRAIHSDENEPVPMELESEEDEERRDIDETEDKMVSELETMDVKEKNHLMEELWIEGVKLPPEPPGECSKELQEKMEVLWKRKVEHGYDYNAVIQNKKAFRNPSIYEKLIDHCNIDELGTNFPFELYDGHLFGKGSYYDELANQQRVEMSKLEKALEAKKKLGESKLKPESKQQHRKSKWDQAAPQGARPGAIGTVIPAFGSLKKK